MGSVSFADLPRASKVAAECGHELFEPNTDGQIVADDQWFMRIAHSLWPEKPAAWLRSLTGFPERTCRAYANGEREPSGPFLIALLLSDQGERVLVSLMGNGTEWWRNLSAAAHVERGAMERMPR